MLLHNNPAVPLSVRTRNELTRSLLRFVLAPTGIVCPSLSLFLGILPSTKQVSGEEAGHREVLVEEEELSGLLGPQPLAPIAVEQPG